MRGSLPTNDDYAGMPKARILIVEDDHALAEVLSYNLQQVGYEVTLAFDGREGLRQAELGQPDLVILDLMLPLVDGLDVCRRLRSRSHTELVDQLHAFATEVLDR